mmetsp:Transcript_21472/g.47739  ORF Transcript_21472/g.47739 Transcript_21472/m.47739 type:complete len:205 (+) Transcript_21472:2583-3197(+)
MRFDVVVEHIHLHAAAGDRAAPTHGVCACRQLHPVRAAYLVVDHEAQHVGHVALVRLPTQHASSTDLHPLLEQALHSGQQRRHGHEDLDELLHLVEVVAQQALHGLRLLHAQHELAQVLLLAARLVAAPLIQRRPQLAQQGVAQLDRGGEGHVEIGREAVHVGHHALPVRRHAIHAHYWHRSLERAYHLLTIGVGMHRVAGSHI